MREMWRHGIGCSLMESKVRQQPQRNDLRRRMGRMGRKLRNRGRSHERIGNRRHAPDKTHEAQEVSLVHIRGSMLATIHSTQVEFKYTLKSMTSDM